MSDFSPGVLQGHLMDTRCDPLQVHTIYPQKLDGITSPKLVKASDGHEYVAKADGWGESDASATNVLYQEWINARLADLIGVPIPSYQLLKIDGVICFGSRYLDLPSPRFLTELYLDERICNPDDLYSIIVMDVWIGNSDRHRRNLAIAADNGSLRLVAIDHSHAPIFNTSPPEGLNSIKNYPASSFVQNYVSQLIVNRSLLANAIERVQTMGTQVIESVLDTPSCVGHRAGAPVAIRDFLSFRQERLSDLFTRSSDHFPALKGGSL